MYEQKHDFIKRKTEIHLSYVHIFCGIHINKANMKPITLIIIII